MRHRRSEWLAWCAAFVCLASTGRLAGAASTKLALLDLSGRQVEPLQDADAKAIIFIFTRTDCPVSNRYAPEIRRLYEEFASNGLVFWLVYVDPNESPESIHKHIKEYDYPLGTLRDPHHSLVKITGAQVTPEVAVFAPGRAGQKLVYRGRIDDRYIDFGKERPTPTTRDLEQVLRRIVAGKQVTLETTRAVGCFISDLK